VVSYPRNVAPDDGKNKNPVPKHFCHYGCLLQFEQLLPGTGLSKL